eukprot:scaffold18676_cov52-Phaeocystis_antarctica.AAC.1
MSRVDLLAHTGRLRLPRYISHPFQNCYDGHPSAQLPVAGQLPVRSDALRLAPRRIRSRPDMMLLSSNTRADLLSRAARANASGGEGRGARPRATDEQLVGVGQGVINSELCGLPSRKEGIRWATAVHAACRGGLDCRLEAGDGEERTPNMLYMSLTLEVSKLSGWLNAVAPCRESNGGHTVRGTRCGPGGGGGRRRATAVHAQRAGEGSTAGLGAGHGEERT